MDRFVFFLILVTLFTGCIREEQRPLKVETAQIIYGKNDILDHHQVRSKKIRHMGRSVAIQVPNYKLRQEGSEYFINEEYLEDLNICSHQDDFHEKLAHQPALGTCTGFLIDKQTILTASHCVETAEECRESLWVFNFKSDPHNLAPASFDEDNVYRCAEIETQNQQLDYAFLKLDRPVYGRTPLKFRKRGKIPSHSRLVVIGYPQGLPLKFSTNAKVRSNQNQTHFVINSDTFEGNSGSPVINTKNNLVEGILVRGGTDFDVDEKSENLCYVIKKCPENQCVGEEILRIKSIFQEDFQKD